MLIINKNICVPDTCFKKKLHDQTPGTGFFNTEATGIFLITFYKTAL